MTSNQLHHPAREATYVYSSFSDRHIQPKWILMLRPVPVLWDHLCTWGSQSGVTLSLLGTLGHVWRYFWLSQLGVRGYYRHRKVETGMLLNILPRTGQPSQQRNIHPKMSAEVEKPCSLWAALGLLDRIEIVLTVLVMSSGCFVDLWLHFTLCLSYFFKQEGWLLPGAGEQGSWGVTV